MTRTGKAGLFLLLLACAAPLRAADRAVLPAAALAYFIQGDFKDALAGAYEVVQDDPHSAAAHALRARIYNALGEAGPMRGDADAALRELPSFLPDVGGLIAEGTALWLEGRPEAAMASFDAALERDKNSIEALAGRARVWRTKGRPDKAKEDFDRLLKLEPKDTLYLYSRAAASYDLGRYDDVLADLTTALRGNLSFYPAFGLLGATFAQKGDTQRALAAYNKSLQLKADYAYGYLGRAALELVQNDLKAAFADFAEAVKAEPRSYAPYYNRAEAYWRLGQRDAARDDYQAAAAAPSLEAEYAVKIGDRLAQLELYAGAIDAYTRAYENAGGRKLPSASRRVQRGVEGRPTLSAVGVNALIHRAAARQSLKELGGAMKDLTEAVQRDPSSSAAWAARGTLFLFMKRESQALTDLNKAVQAAPQDAGSRVARAGFFSRTGQPRDALEDLNAAIAADPNSAEAYNSRGALYVNALNDPGKALDDVVAAVRLNPANPLYRFNLAMLQLKNRNFRQAVDAFSAALELKGPQARILDHRADAYFQLGDHAAALRDLQAALQADAQSALYDMKGSIELRSFAFAPALRDLDKALEMDPANVTALIHRGLAKGALGQLQDALKDFVKAAELDSRSKEAATCACQAQRLLKEPKAALSYCDRAVALDAAFGPAYLQRGLCLLALGRHDQAAQDLDASAQYGVRRGEQYLAGALARAGAGQYRQAHKDYQAAMLVDPSAHTAAAGFGPPRAGPEDYAGSISELEPAMASETRDPYVFITRADAMHNAGRYDKAIVEYTKAMELDGSLADAYVWRGISLTAQESFEAAQQDFLRALELDPKASMTHARLCAMQTLKGKYRAALEEAARALRLDPKNAQAYLCAGNARYFAKDYDRALDNFRLAAQKDLLNPGAHNGLGLGYFALRQYPEAVESFSRALSLNPHSARFYRNRGTAYSDMKSFANAAQDYRIASLLKRQPPPRPQPRPERA